MTIIPSFFVLLLVTLATAADNIEKLPDGLASLRYEVTTNVTGYWVLEYDPTFRLNHMGVKLCQCHCSTLQPTDLEVKVIDNFGKKHLCRNMNDLHKFIEGGTIWFECNIERGGDKRNQVIISGLSNRPLLQKDVVVVVPNLEDSRGTLHLRRFKTGRYKDEYISVKKIYRLPSSEITFSTYKTFKITYLYVHFNNPLHIARINIDGPNIDSLGLSLYTNYYKNGQNQPHHQLFYAPHSKFEQPLTKQLTLWGDFDPTRTLLFHSSESFVEKMTKIHLQIVEDDIVQSLSLFPRPTGTITDSYNYKPTLEKDRSTNAVIVDFKGSVVPTEITINFKNAHTQPKLKVNVAVTNTKTPSIDSSETVHVFDMHGQKEKVLVVGVSTPKRYIIITPHDSRVTFDIQSVFVALLAPGNSRQEVTVGEKSGSDSDVQIKIIPIPPLKVPSIDINIKADSVLVNSDVEIYVTPNRNPTVKADWVRCRKAADSREDELQLKCDKEVQGQVSLVVVSSQLENVVDPKITIIFQDRHRNPIVEVEHKVETETEVAEVEPSDILKDIKGTGIVFRIPRLDKTSSTIYIISDTLFTENQVEVYVVPQRSEVYQEDLIHCRRGSKDGSADVLHCNREIQGDVFLVVLGSSFQMTSDVIATVQFRDRHKSLVVSTKIVIVKESVVPPKNKPYFVELKIIPKGFNYIKIDRVSGFQKYGGRLFFTSHENSQPSEWKTCNQKVERYIPDDLLLKCSEKIKGPEAKYVVLTLDKPHSTDLQVVVHLLDELHMTVSTLTLRIPKQTPLPTGSSSNNEYVALNLADERSFDKISFSTEDPRIPEHQEPMEVYLIKKNGDKVYCTYEQDFSNKKHTYLCNHGFPSIYKQIYLKLIPRFKEETVSVSFIMYVFNTVQNPKSYVYSFGLTLTVKKKPAASLKLESGRADNITFLLVDLKEISDPLTDLHIKQNSGSIGTDLYRVFLLSVPIDVQELIDLLWKDKSLEEIARKQGGSECRYTKQYTQQSKMHCSDRQSRHLLITFNDKNIKAKGSYSLEGETSFEGFHQSRLLFSFKYTMTFTSSNV